MPETSQWIIWILLLGFVLPVIILFFLTVAGFYFGKRWVKNFISPDVSDLSGKLDTLKNDHPDWDKNKLIARMVHKQAIKCGIVGAVTGFGGFLTMIFTLPIDLLVTARYQASMVSFIAQVYGYEDSVENKAATYAVMTGTTEVSKITSRVLEKYLPRIFQGFFSKLIPVLGAGINFGLNYFMAYSTAKLAIRWYESKSRQEIIGNVSDSV